MMNDRYMEEKKMIPPKGVIVPLTRYNTSALPHLSDIGITNLKNLASKSPI